MKKRTNSGRLSQQIDRVVEKKKMLKHPFYRVWSEGRLSSEALREYAKQYYLFVYQFPTFISAIHSNAPTLEDRQLLLSNLMDEEAGEKNHPQLWLKFCDGLGIPREEVKSAIALPETKDLIDTFRTICQKKSFAEGVAALYAYESQIPEVSEEKIASLKRFYNISNPADIEFFSVHQEADIEHSRISRQMLDRITNDSDTKKALQAARKLSQSLWRFLDGIYREFVLKQEKIPVMT